MVVIDITRDKYINCLINLNKDIVIYTYRANPPPRELHKIRYINNSSVVIILIITYYYNSVYVM